MSKLTLTTASIAVFVCLLFAPLLSPSLRADTSTQAKLQLAKIQAQYSNDGNVGYTRIPNSAQVRVYAYVFTNLAAYTCYVHMYNTQSNPIVGTTPTVVTIAIPATSTVSFTLPTDCSIVFTQGIAWSVSKGYADTDTTHALAGDVVGFISYR